MPKVTLPRTYATGVTPTEQDMLALGYALETILNTTKLDGDNIQAGAITAAKVASGAATTEKFQSNAVTSAKLAAAVTAFLAPTGQIVPYVGTSAPTGWLLCDGTAVSRTTYSALYAVIADTHGEGNGSTTFNVPDFRGRFLRGMDDGQGTDPDAASRTAMNTGGNTGDAIGTLQGGATGLPQTAFATDDVSHTHTYSFRSLVSGSVSQAGTYRGGGSLTSITTSSAGSHTHTLSGGDNETRPINAYVNFIIKT